ncbi:plasmid pRiA4b ORF-3 family protein [Sinorhizobium meliloti]|nr:plasmid pRiA4b ORF-3 family protein [Sinorhizobium meliloti]MDE3823043.1 plasmid pRiA4b ORF-3 family protein [Sinorhizobium meliloti]QPI28602.1 plasmid pRiA4b ORF-3 family protein [Sinorhizobium meliloti]
MHAKLVPGMICGMLDPFDPDRFIVRAEVHILGIEPKISRTLELPITLNLAQLHEVLQAAFGWTDSHLHQFNIGGLIYGAPEFDEDGLSDSRTFEATEVRMIDLQFPYDPEENPLTILYEYDFGDNWRHLLRLERVARQEGVKYPRCLAGKRSGPPEDVGGTSGYADFLDAWLDPDHEEHKAMRRWVGRKFQPEACNLDEINKAIGKALRASKGDYRFRRESHRD